MKIPWWILPLSALWIYKQRTNLCEASSPCSLNNGGCSQHCVPQNSRHECQCLTGLPEEKDGKTCEDKVNKLILFTDAEANSANIIFLGANYSVSRTLFKDPDSDFLVALDFDRVQDRVYWTDESRGRIMSAFRNGSSAKILYFCNVLRPVGLAIDHVGRNVYWTDAGTDRIEIGRLDGTKRKVLFKDGLNEPGAIVLDEKNGLIFWTDHGNEPKIEKASQDGWLW
ncbi:low-density lipoprotein receptor-related protein 6-like [Stylophora pistillata]|uniref:low-density lipoprotein receptor-related protein 6-like n=1 Tax=Stylophora pistillata TaxID=50429 RepID=UPI000C03E498|nr:low-density lipoprotein receptor-related protein 6-like [Stylophora pistillata]XP_022809445.1 low-density lipoprotein receptor-related protein 6-like [Stylophora pistillata]